MVVNKTKVYSVFMTDYDSYNEVARYLDKNKAEEVAEVLGYDVGEETIEYESFSKAGYEYIKERGLKEYTIDMVLDDEENYQIRLRRDPIMFMERIYNIVIARKFDKHWVDYAGHVWATSEDAAMEYIKLQIEKNEEEFIINEELFVDGSYEELVVDGSYYAEGA